MTKCSNAAPLESGTIDIIIKHWPHTHTHTQYNTINRTTTFSEAWKRKERHKAANELTNKLYNRAPHP